AIGEFASRALENTDCRRKRKSTNAISQLDQHVGIQIGRFNTAGGKVVADLLANSRDSFANAVNKRVPPKNDHREPLQLANQMIAADDVRKFMNQHSVKLIGGKRSCQCRWHHNQWPE